MQGDLLKSPMTQYLTRERLGFFASNLGFARTRNRDPYQKKHRHVQRDLPNRFTIVKSERLVRAHPKS